MFSWFGLSFLRRLIAAGRLGRLRRVCRFPRFLGRTLLPILFFALRRALRSVARVRCFFGRVFFACERLRRLGVFRLALSALGTLLAVLLFVLGAQLFGQFAGALFDLGLIILQLGSVIPSLRPALHGPLQAQ